MIMSYTNTLIFKLLFMINQVLLNMLSCDLFCLKKNRKGFCKIFKKNNGALTLTWARSQEQKARL